MKLPVHSFDELRSQSQENRHIGTASKYHSNQDIVFDPTIASPLVSPAGVLLQLGPSTGRSTRLMALLLPLSKLSDSQAISSSIPILLSCRADNAMDNGELITVDG